MCHVRAVLLQKGHSRPSPDPEGSQPPAGCGTSRADVVDGGPRVGVEHLGCPQG